MKKKKQMGSSKKRDSASFRQKEHNPDRKTADKLGKSSKETLQQGSESNRADSELQKLIENKSSRNYPTAKRRNK